MSAKKSPLTLSSDQPYYLATPATESKYGVLVLPAWWGLNAFFKQFCNRLAREGFVTLAFDYYHGKIASTVEEAEHLRSTIRRKATLEAISQAAAHLQTLCDGQDRDISVVGFSLGAYWALWLAEQKSSPVTATVAFYGTRTGDYAASRSAFQFHFAETDPYESAVSVKRFQKKLLASGREAEFHTYPGTTHWFFEKDRPEAYNASAARLAWQRTVKFLKQHVPS
jgi:carboxymethylenebutenolidase